MSELRQSRGRSHSLIAHSRQPLIAIPIGDDEVQYFTSDEEADAFVANGRAAEPISLAGVWSDLDWTEAERTLDRIRHESEPTPPIDSI